VAQAARAPDGGERKGGRSWRASASRQPRRRRRGPRPVPPPGCCTTRRCRRGAAASSTRWRQTSTASVAAGVLPADLVTRNRPIAEAALRPWTPVFMHGDLQVAHVFLDEDEVTGVLNWSEAGQGDALFDLAVLTLGHEEHLGDVVDLEVIHGWWSLRSLRAIRWLIGTASTRSRRAASGLAALGATRYNHQQERGYELGQRVLRSPA
jgi:aminoglycoside phosphotransferase (APT) family kinase protein